MPSRKSFEEVKRNIEAACPCGTVLLSTEYKTTKNPLLFRCECGNIFQRKYEKFIGGAYRCKECRDKDIAKRYKFSLDDVKKMISDAGCEYIGGEYVNNQSVLTIRCSCGNVFTRKFIKFRSGRCRCPKCGSAGYKGENSHFYKGGCSSAYYAIRESLLKWKDDVRTAYNNTCPITGEQGDLCDVHHIVPLRSIYKPIADEYGVEINQRTKISDIPEYDILDKIRERTAEAHTVNIGILISKKIHYQYHALYKGKNCNEKTFEHFLKDKYNVELSTIRR